MRRAHSRPGVSRLGDIPFPENIEPWHLVEVQRPDAGLPEQMIGPEGRLRRRDGFTLTDARWQDREVAQRNSLLRAVPRARQGLVLEGLQGDRERARPATLRRRSR